MSEEKSIASNEAPQLASAPAGEPPQTPAPTATGNEHLKITRHQIFVTEMGERWDLCPGGVEMAIWNVSDKTIATAVFEAVFYDEKGSVLDIVQHTEVDLRADGSRAIRIETAIPDRERAERDRISSYAVAVVRTVTADVEKVQLGRHWAKTNANGEEEVSGTVKNLSSARLDTAVLVTFYGGDGETIGTEVVVIKDVKPNDIRRFDLSFRPRAGDVVRKLSLSVAEA